MALEVEKLMPLRRGLPVWKPRMVYWPAKNPAVPTPLV